MRLAQIARKVGVTPTEIRRFLEKEFDLTIGNEPNYKLDEKQIDVVLEEFPIPVVETPEVKPVKSKIDEPEETDSSNIATKFVATDESDITIKESAPIEKATDVENAIKTEVDTVTDQSEDILNYETADIAASTDETNDHLEEVISSNESPELDTTPENSSDITSAVEINYEETGEENDDPASFKEVPVDPDAALIKAPLVKLDGLKVLGKIELPEKKKEITAITSEDDGENAEADAIASLDAAMQSQVQDIKVGKIDQPKAKEVTQHIENEENHSEYKDEKGIYHFSTEQRNNRAISLERIALKRKNEEEKEKKKLHYEKQMSKRAKTTPKNAKKPKDLEKIIQKKIKREQKNAPKPKGIWAKFLHWLND